MAAIKVAGLTHRFGRRTILDNVEFEVPSGSMYALLGPNGTGKTTLMKILLGLLTPTSGRVQILGRDRARLTLMERASIGYVAEGQPLPDWMTLKQLEAYLAPLYPTWDHAHANDLRNRFSLDGSRKLRIMSRGERMKAALLTSLAPRPRLLIMDEPFTGIDVVVKDELVRGLLASAGEEGWSVLISSHDIGELEMLCDWVGFLNRGRMRISESMEDLRDRFLKVEVVRDETADSLVSYLPDGALSVEHNGRLLSFLLRRSDDTTEYEMQGLFRGAERIDVRPASLREVFVALAREEPAATTLQGVAQ